jgi:choline dehydrogenase-like flavoprotein
MTDDASVVIVGSGVAGGYVAEVLIGWGYTNVVMLEAGPSITMSDPRIWLDTVTNGTVPYANLYDIPGDFAATGPEPWNIIGGRLFGRGGSTIHWGGWCPRFMPEDFQLYTNTGLGIDWPFSYADLEPFYCYTEEFLQVSGEEVPGQRDWRSQPYPLAAAPYPITAGQIISALEAQNISYQHMPTARNTVAINSQAQCMTHTTCQYCPIGARFTGNQPLDLAETTGYLKIITSAAAQKILTSNKSTVTGVQYLDLTTGDLNTINADIVFICAGALETPKLLLASANPDWPYGIGNDYALVGAFLVANPYVYCRGTAPNNPQALQQELSFPTLCSRFWDTPELQATGKFLMNMSHDLPFLAPGQMMFQGQTIDEIQQAVQGMVTYELQGAVSPLPYQQNCVGLSSGTTRFGLPKTLISTPQPIVPDSTIAYFAGQLQKVMAAMGFEVTESGSYPQRGDHSAGTCRMALSPDQGVVAPNLQVFGTDNLYIASNAILPTIGAANLTLTLIATIMKAFVDSPLNPAGHGPETRQREGSYSRTARI